MSENPGQLPRPRRTPRASVEELARSKGVRPVASLNEMSRDVFASDDEVEQFVAFVRAERDAGRS